MQKKSESGTYIKDEWAKISIWCMNHDEPVPMQVTQNRENFRTPFYACEHRAGMNGVHPICANRLNLDDYQGIVLQLFDIIGQDPLCDLTNRTFSYRGARQKLQIRVLEYTEESIRLGILNRTILRGGAC